MKTAALILALSATAFAGDWTPPVEVRQDDNLCLTYRARLDGPYLVIRASIESGWHTFAMDNKQRADEKLAGKPALSVDRPTSFTITGGAAIDGPWAQTQPKDFSRPQLRWFSWGFDREAVFAAKLKRTSTDPIQIAIRGQACTETVCKNIDATLSLPSPPESSPSPELDLKSLVPVRTN